MREPINTRTQITHWAKVLAQVRNQFAININPGQAYRDFDSIIKEMKEYAEQSVGEPGEQKP